MQLESDLSTLFFKKKSDVKKAPLRLFESLIHEENVKTQKNLDCPKLWKPRGQICDVITPQIFAIFQPQAITDQKQRNADKL